MAPADTPIQASCHCGAITATALRLPEYVNFCQCTICRRYSAAWAYYKRDEVKIQTKPNAVVKQYIWGDSDLSFNFCDNCGCVCYWMPVRPSAEDGSEQRMGINSNNMDPELLKLVTRKYDYGALMSPLRSKDTAHPEDLATYRPGPASSSDLSLSALALT